MVSSQKSDIFGPATTSIRLHLYKLGFPPSHFVSYLRLITENREKKNAFESSKPCTETSSTHRTADPALHSGDTEGTDPNEVGKVVEAQEKYVVEGLPPKKPTKDFDKGNHRSSVNFTVKDKLVINAVNPPIDPIMQQKRHFQLATEAAGSPRPEIPEVSCVGIDGTPLTMDEENEKWRNNEDDKEYFKDRKPSSLSGFEMADTRKPITRATDGTADYILSGDLNEVIGWREEQLDTAEEALKRATLIWKESAMRGDPDSPQSRALRALLADRGDLSS